eukprot:762433-Hanusia_phi.AAC.16
MPSPTACQLPAQEHDVGHLLWSLESGLEARGGLAYGRQGDRGPCAVQKVDRVVGPVGGLVAIGGTLRAWPAVRPGVAWEAGTRGLPDAGCTEGGAVVGAGDTYAALLILTLGADGTNRETTEYRDGVVACHASARGGEDRTLRR